MIRRTTLALATIAVASVGSASISSAKADGYWPNYSFTGGHADCHWEKQKFFVGYDHYGQRIYRWKKVKICH